MSNKFPFTKTAIEGLPLPEKRANYHDSKIPGLILQMTPNGVRTFYSLRKVNGKTERVQIGRFPAVTVELARKRAEEINGNIAQGKNPAEEKRTLKAELTLKEVFDEFGKTASVKHRSWTDEKRRYDQFIQPAFGNKRLSQITDKDVKALHKRIGEDTGEVRANRVVTFLRALFNYADSEMDYKGENPCRHFKKFKFSETARARFMQENELPKFFSAVLQEPDPTLRDFVLMLLLTGQRRDNVLKMRWDEINLNRGEWTIPAEKFKGKRPHVLPLIGPAMEILSRRKDRYDGEWVFPSAITGKPLVNALRGWNRILTTAKIEDLNFHDLRRTLASYMGITGTPEGIIAGMLGHKIGAGDSTSATSATWIYNRHNLDAVRRSMETAVEYMLREGNVLPRKCKPVKYKIIAFRKQG